MARAKRIILGTGAVVLAAVVVSTAIFRPDRAARVGAGVAAHNLCSATFVAGLDPEVTLKELVRPILGDQLSRHLHYQVDRESRSVQTTFLGIFHARADFTPGYGCRLEFADTPPAPAPRALSPAPVSDDFAPAGVVTSSDPVIIAAMDRVFDEHPGEKIKRVKAVVIVKNGHVIAERYAPGFGVDTPLLSYSAAKSFTNALLGILVRQGKLRVDQPLGAPEWQGKNDPRASITIENLLRMCSGLSIEETDSGFSPHAWMEYLHNDMAAYAASYSLRTKPGTEWDYTSGNTLLLDRLIGQTVGGGAAGLRSFAEKALLEPARLSNLTMEFDGSGVFFGSSYVYAPARTYARFGELYRNDGVAPDGQRLLPEGWVAWSKRSTLGAPYGAGFWTNDGPSHFAAMRVAQGFPKDGFFASGFLGQRIYIIPSEHLVVVRFGYSAPPDFGIVDDMALIAAAIHATHDPAKDSLKTPP